MSCRPATVAALLAVLFAPAPAAARSACWFPNERDAAQVRALQTMLMVGTLKCRGEQQGMADAYNRFVEGQRGRLTRYERALTKRFRREHGDAGRAALDRYNTALANQYSEVVDRRGSCGWLVPIVTQATAADAAGLTALARSYTTRPVERDCGLVDRLS